MTLVSEPAEVRGLTVYPVNLVLYGAPCLVIGGGHVAARKVAGLLDAGASVTVVAPDAVELLRDDPRVRWHARPYQRGEVASYRLAITATGIVDVDAQVHRDAEAAGVPVNSADDPDRCTFILPAVVRRGDVQLTVSTGGRSPAFASWLRSEIELWLDDGPIPAFELLASVRDEMRAAGIATEHPGWHEALSDGLPLLVQRGNLVAARALLLRHLALTESDLVPSNLARSGASSSLDRAKNGWDGGVGGA